MWQPTIILLKCWRSPFRGSKFQNFAWEYAQDPPRMVHLSGHLSEPPFTKSWIYPSCVSACWHVCLTTCVPVCTSECLHVCVWMTACLHICIFAGLSLYPHVCISWCVHVCVSAWLHTCTCLLCVCVLEKGCYVCMSVWVADWEKKPTVGWG